MFWNATPSFQEFQRRLQNPKYVQTVQANYRAHGRSGDAFDTLSGFRDYFCVSDEDKQDMTQGVGNMIADTKARLAGQQRYNKLKQHQDKQRGIYGRLDLGVKNPLTNDNVVREPLTGRYLTSDGAEYAQEFEAARAQNHIDETSKRYTEAVERGDIPSAFEVRDKDGNYALMEDLGVKPGVHVTEKGKQQQLAGLVNTRKSVEEQYNALYRKLEKDFKRSAPFSLNTHSQYGIDDNDMRLQAYLNSNAQYRRLKAQLHQLDNAIGVGKEAVKGRAEERYVKNAKGMLGYAYRDLKTFGASALRGLWNAVSDVSTWDMGLQDLQDNMTLYTTVKKARQKGYKNLNSEERQMLDVAAKTGAYTAENQQYLGRGYKAGNVTGESLPFMVEMALNPASGLGEAAMSKYMRNAIAKYGKEAVRKEAWKYVTKKCGYRIAGDVLGAALMTGTTGSARTLADTYDRLTGDIKSTYDSNGKIVYDGTENEETGILKAYLKAFGATAIENHSEFVGEYFNPLLKGAGTLTMKGWKKVNAKSANAFLDNLKDMGSTSTAKWLGNLFEKTQWHGTIGEYAEEVVGNIENALLVGDSTLDAKEGTGVFNLDQNIDTFLGVSLMGGFFSTLKTGAYIRDKVKGERKILMQQSLDLDNSIRYALGADPRLTDKWKEWRVALAQGTDEEKKQALKEISENTNGNIKKAMYDYSANAQKLAGMDKATQGAIEDGTITPEQAQRDADIEQAHEEGLAAEGTARHDIQQEHQLRENSLARMLGISAEQLDRMEDEDIESMTGQNDALDTAIYDYQTSRERYQGVIDRATDEVEQAGIDAAHQIDLYTDHSTGQIRPCVIKGNNGKEDYQGYIVNGNIATHPDGAIDVSGSDKMILYFDPETGKIEHGDASTFASLGESADATVARQQAIDEAKQQAAQAQSRDIDGGVGEDGNVSEAMPTSPQSSDQEERNAADFDIGQVVNAETGEVIPVSFEGLAEGENAYLTGGRPDGKAKDRLKVTIVDAEGNVTNRVMKRGNVQVDGRMSAEDFRNAYEEAVSSRIAPEADMNGQENNVNEEGVVAGDAVPSADRAATSEEEGAASEPAVRDKNGNPIYDKMPISATIADLYDGALDDAEIDGFVSAQIAEAEKAVEKMEKKKPKVGTDKAKYLADKKAWEEGLQEAQRKVQYWQDVKAEVEKITTPEDARGYEEELNGDAAQTAYRNGSDAAAYGAREVTAEFMQSGDVKITPESYRKETGFGAAEQRAMVGKISKGGKSIDKLAEDLEVFDRENYNGMYFGGDSSVAKDAILDYLSSPDSRKGVKKMQSEAEREYVEAYEAERDRYYQEKYHMSYEEYLVYSSQEMPELLRKYSNFDEQLFLERYADEIEAALQKREEQLKQEENGKEGNVSAGEESGHGRSNRVQSGERTYDTGRGEVGKDSAGEVGPRHEGVVESEAALGSGGSTNQQRIGRVQKETRADVADQTMTHDEAIAFIAAMENRAEVAPSVDLSIENWDSLFGLDGIVNTPIGKVKMGDNQFTKMMREDRHGKLGMVKPTLENPDAILEDASKAKAGDTEERPSSYIFVKAFKKSDGSRYYYFTSITVSKDGLEVVVSNQEKRKNAIANLLSKDKLVWKHADDVSDASDVAQGLYSSQGNVSDLATEGTDAPQTSMSNNDPTSSESKDTNNTDTKQENGEKSVGGEKEPMSPTPAMIDRMIAEQRVDDVSELLISSELKKAAEGIAEAFGMKVVYLKKVFIKSNDPAVEDFDGNGFVRNGVIYLSLKEADIAQFTFGHELLHQLKQIDADSYMRIRQKVIDVMGRKAFEMEVKARQVTYANVPGYTLYEDYAEEVIADTLGDIITHTDMLPDIARSLKDNPSLLDRFLKVVDNVRQYFRGKIGGALGDLVNDIRDTYEMTARQGAETNRMEAALDAVNDRFNDRLESLVANPNQKDRVLRLGRSSEFLRDGGLADAEIVLEFDKLARKSKEGYKNEHPFDMSDIKDLPKAIASPIAVFGNTSGENDGNVILTELKKDGKNFIVAVKTMMQPRKGGVVLEVNQITSLFPKDAKGIVHWFNSGKATNIDKEKALRFIEALPNHPGTTIKAEELISAANVVKDFETAKESEEKDRQRYASLGVSRSLGKEAAEGEPRWASLGLSTPLKDKIAAASADVDTDPTEAQKEAGNYKKGHVKVGMFDITIEQPQGSVRKGTDADGKQWESKMNNTYGYIRGAVGVDGDHIDVFLSNNIDGWDGRKVFVVDQYNPDGSFDEHKVMLGFNDADEAKGDYLANYEEGWENGRRIDVSAVNLEDFEKWIASSKRKTKPFSEYKNVKSESAESPKTGAFGTVYTQFRGKAQEAIAFLLEKKEGEAVGALHHKDIGDIDLVWGKEGTAKSDGFGLAKLAKYHPEVLGNLQEILDAMVVVKRTDNRVQLESETHQASVRLTWDSEKKNWLLTAFEKKNSVSDNTTDTVGTAEGGKRNDTATPQNTVSEGKDTEKVSSGQEDGEKSVLSDLEREFQKALEHEEDVEQKWEDKIQDYVAEHYPTQATVSAATTSAKGVQEREAMKSDHVLRAMREKADAEYKEARDATFAAQKEMETAKESDGKDRQLYASLGVSRSLGEEAAEGEPRWASLGLSTPLKITEHTKFSLKDNQGNPLNQDGTLKLDKIKSVDDLTDEDFLHPTRNVELPSLPKKIADAIGTEGKPVIIKKNIFERNYMRHKDVTPELSKVIFKYALYDPDLYGQNQKKTRPYNWVLINTKDEKGNNRTVLLEVNPNKDNVEIVHWHFVNDKNLGLIKKQAIREGDQVLILPSEQSEEVGGLSNLTDDLSAANVDNSSETAKESEGKDRQRYASLGVSRSLGEEAAEGEPRWASLGLSEQQLAERQEVNGGTTLFSLKKDRTLAGVHNITEEKLLKAIKQGGLANPSVAVIDSSKQNHDGYGDISLILPSDKVAKRTGKNAGTWQGDAWTPTYPQVERQMSNKGAEKASNDVGSVPGDMYSEVRRGLDRWLDGGEENSAMAYMFLHEKGVAPEPKKIQPKFSDEAYNELKSITAGNFNIYGIGKADARKVLDMYIDAKFDGDKDLYEEKTKAWLERNKSIVDAGANGGMRYAIAKENVELYDEYGFNYKGVQTFVRDVEYDHRKTGVDMNATLNEVEDYIKTNNLTDEFNTWMEGKEKEYGIKEVIFDGFTPSGNRRYVPNTLENVSKIMKKQGRNGSTGISVSFQNFAARLMPSYGTLKDIRSKKGLLTSDREKFDNFREKWSNVFFELGMKCQPDATGTFDDYGLARLSEAAMASDPQAYLKKEYNVDFSDEDTKRLKEMVKAIKEESPAMYFETKFERPVHLDEFAAAVVPTTASNEVKQALQNAGVQIYEYDKEKEGDRSCAFNEAINSSDNIRFSLDKDKGTVVSPSKPSKAEAVLRDAVIDRLRENGMEVITDVAEGQKVLDKANGKGKLQMGDAPETFAERQKLAVENRGVVMPGLNETYVEVVKDIPRHGYTGTIAEATKQAIQKAKEKYVPEGKVKVLHYDNNGAEFDYVISGNAIEICLSPKHQAKSGNKGVHLALAEHLDEVINKSVEVEEHPDYIKGKDGKRGEYINPNAIMHRFYGVAIIDGVPCRIMTLMREDARSEESNGIHSYEVQKIEMLDNELPSISNGVGTQINELSAYPLAKLLKGVEKAYDKGKYLLEESEKRSAGLREQRMGGADGLRFFRTANGEAYGFTVGGKIYVDPRIATSETPVHEYAHLWASALRSGNKEEWQNVVGLMKDSKVWDEVKKRYPELKTDDEIADEVIATYSGRRGAERLREEQRKIAEGNGGVFEKAEAISALEKVKRALKMFWKGVADFLHIHYKSAEEVADRVMKDLLEGVDPRMMGNVVDGVSNQQTLRNVNNQSLFDAIHTLYSKGKTFAEKIYKRKFFDVAETPDFMKRLGLTGDKFTIRYGVISRHFGKDNQHDFTEEEWKQMPKALSNPILITEYYQDDQQKRQKGYRLYTPLKLADGSYAVVSAEVKNAGKNLEINAINTIFGRNAVSDIHDRIVYQNPKITLEQMSLLGKNNPHQYPSDQELSDANVDNSSETAKEYEGKDRQRYVSLGVSRALGEEAGEGEPRWASWSLSEQQLDGDDTVRFSLNYDKWDREMASWLKRNRLPKNAQRPVVPQREVGESDLHFAGRLAKYNQDKALWNTAPKYEGHLSSGMTARGEFNYELQRGSVLTRIAVQDSMLAIRKAQEAIARHSGLLKVGTFEDAYMAENNSHGKAKNEFEQYDQEYLAPLRKWFNVMMKRLDGSYNNVTNYMIAKHGLERNAHMAFMAALEAEAKKAIDNTQPDAKRLRAQMVHDAYKQYKADSRRLINDADYQSGKYDYAQWRRTDDAIRKSYCSNYESFRYNKGGVVRDYAGLSSLFQNETDFEEKAAELCADIESKNGHETGELWDAVRQATRQILKNSHDAGMMSDETYDYVRGMYEHYVPLRGWNDSAADEVWDYAGGGRGVFNAALKEAHGRQSLADDPVAYIMNMAESGFLVNNKNWVKQHFLMMAMNHPTDLLTVSKAWYVKTKDQFGNEVWIPASPNIPADETDPAVIQAALDAFQTKMEQMEQSGDATQQRGSLNIEYPQTKMEEREHEVRVMKDGEEYVIYVNGDPQLAQALNNTRAMRVREHEGLFEKACAWLGRKMAAVYTSLSPLFVPSNWARDTTMTLASTAIREDARYNWLLRTKFMRPDVQMRMFGLVKEYQNGKLREKVKSNKATKTEKNFWNFMINGGETGFVSTMDVDAFRNKIQRDLKDMGRTRLNPVKVGHIIADSVEYINRVIEDSNRFAIYQTSIEYGRGIEEAVQDAKNVTLNFNRKGTGEMGMSAIRQLFLFINPAIQSLQTLGALAKEHKAKFTAVTSAWMASGMLVPLFNELMFNLASAAAGGGGDDDDEFNPKDEYWKFSSFDRRNNCILWIPFTHNFIKIPLAQEFRGFYGIGDMVASAMWGGENAKESWSNYAADLMGQIIDLSPLDPVSYDGNVLVSLMPNAIRPLVEIAQNVTFTGKPIYRESDFNKYDPSFKKAYAGTPDFLLRYSKWMNSIGNKYPEAQQGPVEQTAVGRYANNPAVIDHLLKSYLGGMYTLGSQIAGAITKASDEETRKDFKTADIPFFSKFVANPNDRPQSKNKGDAYWQDFEKYQRSSHTLGVIRQDARKTGNFSVLEDFYKSEEYKEMKEYEPKAKQRKEEQKYEKWKEEGNADLYQPHQQTGEDVYKRHSTPADDFEDTKASILYQKIKPAKDIFDLADINTPSGMDTFNKYYDLAGKVEEAHSVKKEMNAIVKSFVNDEHKATFDPEKMKEYRALRKQYLQLVEDGNRMFEKIKAQRN